MLEGPAAGRGELGGLVAGCEGLIEVLSPGRRRSSWRARALVRSASRSPSPSAWRSPPVPPPARRRPGARPAPPGARGYREEVVDGQSDYATATSASRKRAGSKTSCRRLEHDHEERRDRRLVHQQRPSRRRTRPPPSRGAPRPRSWPPPCPITMTRRSATMSPTATPNVSSMARLHAGPASPQADHSRYGGEERTARAR